MKADLGRLDSHEDTVKILAYSEVDKKKENVTTKKMIIIGARLNTA